MFCLNSLTLFLVCFLDAVVPSVTTWWQRWDVNPRRVSSNKDGDRKDDSTGWHYKRARDSNVHIWTSSWLVQRPTSGVKYDIRQRTVSLRWHWSDALINDWWIEDERYRSHPNSRKLQRLTRVSDLDGKLSCIAVFV